MITEYPTSARSQGEAALEHLRTHPGPLRLTRGQRDRIVRESRAQRTPEPRWTSRSA